MSLTLLHRINPAKNEYRFYLVMTGPALFDEHAVIRFWGRIGGHQHHMVSPCPTADDAARLAARLVQRRLKHGYKIINQEREI